MSYFFLQESSRFGPHTDRHPSVTTQTSLTTGELIQTPYSPINSEFCCGEWPCLWLKREITDHMVSFFIWIAISMWKKKERERQRERGREREKERERKRKREREVSMIFVFESRVWLMVGVLYLLWRLSQCILIRVLKVFVLETGNIRYCSISGNYPFPSQIMWVPCCQPALDYPFTLGDTGASIDANATSNYSHNATSMFDKIVHWQFFTFHYLTNRGYKTKSCF